jgi:hypothetical protein
VRNPFRRVPVDELIRRQRIEDEVKKDLAQLRKLASDILQDTRYKHFADIFKKAEENTVLLLMNYNEPDPYKYSARVREFLIELRVFRNIMHSVNELVNPLPDKPLSMVERFKKALEG